MSNDAVWMLRQSSLFFIHYSSFSQDPRRRRSADVCSFTFIFPERENFWRGRKGEAFELETNNSRSHWSCFPSTLVSELFIFNAMLHVEMTRNTTQWSRTLFSAGIKGRDKKDCVQQACISYTSMHS